MEDVNAFREPAPLDASSALSLIVTGDPTLYAVVRLSLLVTLFIASLSWYLMEKPLNSLKRYFDDPFAAKETSHER